MADDQSLTDALQSVGVTHKPSDIEGKRDLFDESGALLGTFDAGEGWAFCEQRRIDLQNKFITEQLLPKIRARAT